MPRIGEEGKKGVLKKVDNLTYFILLVHSLFEFLFPFKLLPSVMTIPTNGRMCKKIFRGEQVICISDHKGLIY